MSFVVRIFIYTLCLNAGLQLGLTGDVQMEVEENMVVTLTCPSAEKGYIQRAWYRGRFDNVNLPGPRSRLFNQLRSGAVNRDGARPDMTLNEQNFQLTIERAQLIDDSNFTCSTFTTDLKSVYDVIQLSVYIQPRLVLSGINRETYRQNDKVTVNCTVDRIYPPIPLSRFSMSWGDDQVAVVRTRNRDYLSFKYSGQSTRKLGRDDNGKEISCSLDPIRGTVVTAVKTLNVHYISVESPFLVVSNAKPYLESEVTFTCSRGDITDNPPASAVNWYRDGHVLREWEDGSVSHTLTVTTSDSGLYACRVGNIIGYSAISAPIQVNVSSTTDPFYTNVAAGVGGTLGILVLIVLGIIIFLVIRKRRQDGILSGKFIGFSRGPAHRPADKVTRDKAGRLEISAPVSVEIVGNTVAAMEGQSRPVQRAPRPKSMPCDPSTIIWEGQTDMGRTVKPGKSLQDALDLISAPESEEPTENYYENVKRHSAIN